MDSKQSQEDRIYYQTRAVAFYSNRTLFSQLITPENLPSVVVADHFSFSESAFLQAPSVNWPINIPYENTKVDDLETKNLSFAQVNSSVNHFCVFNIIDIARFSSLKN